jgi:formate hydrogenlyase subunit 4
MCAYNQMLWGPLNLLLFAGLAPLFEGLIRKITARVQSRQGPPLLQPYYDLLKLLGKENMDPSGGWPFRLAPAVALASILAVVLILPVAGKETFLTPRTDMITLVYLLTLGGVATLMGALASKSTFALIGASREMITMIMIEPLMVMMMLPAVIKYQSLDMGTILYGGAINYSWTFIILILVGLLALQAFVAKQPFDIAEAEIELAGGPLIEYTGPNLAFFKFYLMIKQLFYAYLLSAIFIPLLNSGSFYLDLLVQLLEITAVFVLIALLSSTNPRFRIDQALRYYAVLFLLALGSIGASLYIK